PFRECFLRRRCLIPADGFYEWTQDGKRRQGHFIRLGGKGLMALAGLWDVWKGKDGQSLATCCVITTAANRQVSAIHDRMPAVVQVADYRKWLDPATPVGELTPLLVPFPSDGLSITRVGPAVNKA